jgi:hypothetical protein
MIFSAAVHGRALPGERFEDLGVDLARVGPFEGGVCGLRKGRSYGLASGEKSTDFIFAMMLAGRRSMWMNEIPGERYVEVRRVRQELTRGRSRSSWQRDSGGRLWWRHTDRQVRHMVACYETGGPGSHW